MRIKQEDFDKLNQLDRIEFRQIWDEIEDAFETGHFFRFVIVSAFILGFMILVLFSVFQISEKLFQTLAFAFGKYSYLLFILLLFGLIADIITVFRRRKAVNELESKFFKLETKKRK